MTRSLNDGSGDIRKLDGGAFIVLDDGETYSGFDDGGWVIFTTEEGDQALHEGVNPHDLPNDQYHAIDIEALVEAYNTVHKTNY